MMMLVIIVRPTISGTSMPQNFAAGRKSRTASAVNADSNSSTAPESNRRPWARPKRRSATLKVFIGVKVNPYRASNGYRHFGERRWSRYA